MKKFILIVLCFNISLVAFASDEDPAYCQKNAVTPSCKPENLREGNSNLVGVLELSNSLEEQQFRENLKSTALIRLLEQKRNLLTPYPELYPHTDKTHPFFHYGLGHKKVKERGIGYIYGRDCIPTDSKLRNRLETMEKEFEGKRKEVANDTFQINHLGSLLLGAIAAEEGIKQRPGISQKIEREQEKLDKVNKKLAAAKDGKVISQTRRGARIKKSPCVIFEKESKQCKRFEKQMKKSQTYADNKKTEIDALKNKRNILDESIFKNPFYARPTGLGDSTANLASTVVNFKHEYLGNFQKTDFLIKSLASLKKRKGADYRVGILNNIKNSHKLQQETGTSGIAISQAIITDLLTNDKDLKGEIKKFYIEGAKSHLDDLNESVSEICDSKGESLYKIPELVKTVKNEFLINTHKKLGSNADLTSYLDSFQKNHCSIIEKEINKKILGMSKATVTQIGAGVATLGLGVATAFGCVPCFGLAISTGGIAAGAGVIEANSLQGESDVIRGLASINLADQEKARDLLREAQAGWAFVGVDIALAPLGLKGGAMIKAGKSIKAGRKELAGTELADNKDLFKAMGRGLPDDEFKRIIKQMKELPVAEQIILADKLKDLKKISEAKKLTIIAKAMKDHKIDFPDGKALNNRILKDLESDPTRLARIQKDYAESMLELKITKGTPEEEAFIRIAGILENKGCAGFCRKKIVSQADGVKEYKRRIGSCSI